MSSLVFALSWCMSACKLPGICRNAGTVDIEFGQFSAWRHSVWVVSGILRLVVCSSTLMSLSECDLVTRKQ